ncbi:MAG: thiamine pyrophosphate-binding protein [Microbacterium sp.]|uniref:thiamine pyrophosphate-binding protein n=1 Tax=Microbacterium sp. TaxID=51671 RepID=UPI003F7FB905
MAEVTSTQLQIDTAEWLAAHGSPPVFGLMGVGNLHLILALGDLDVAYVAGRHENGVVAAADGWARVTGRIGVATVSRGAGLANGITALVECRKSSTPLVLFVGERAPSPHDTQFLEQEELVRSVGIHYVRLCRNDVEDSLEAIFTFARTAHQPVVVELSASAEHPALPAIADPPLPRQDAITAAATLLAAAKRPLILAGRGAVVADADVALQRLADATGAMLATTAMAHGMFAGDPRNLGVCGGFASPEAAEVLSKADVVAVFGASLNQWTLRHGRLFDTTTAFVRCDLSREALAQGKESTVKIAGDARQVADLIGSKLRNGKESGPWGRIGSGSPRPAPAAGRVDAEEVCRHLAEALPRTRTLSVDSGHFFGFPIRHIEPDGARSNVFSQAFLSMGLSIASGVGAAIARRDAISVVVAGDGGAAMSIGELDTACRYNARMLLCIMNDAAFGMEVHELNRFGLPPASAQFEDIDFAAVARGLGAEAATIRSLSDLEVVDRWVTDGRGPLVLDCKIDPTRVADWYLERATPEQRALLAAGAS